MTTLDKCPVCKSGSFKYYLACQDFTVSKELFNIVSCNTCSFKFTNPRPSDEVLGEYYKSEDYISHSNTKRGLVSSAYHFVRNFTLKRKLALISKFVSRGTILDYGCGTGMFLDVCTKNGWRTTGVEPDDGARKIARQMELTVYPDLSSLAKMGSGKFDVITLWHVLEHVTNLNPTLEFFKENLNSNGTLIIAVPNYKSFDAEVYGQFWAAYDVPRHLYHFDRESIGNLLGQYGFQLQEVQPMKFDSYYVSMLSEKYRSGSVKYMRAFGNGLRSNLKAASSKQHSSHIYIFKAT